jgi:cytolysin-activating lysine-acyltransferase
MTLEVSNQSPPAGVTAAHVLGEIGWLMAQSPIHAALPLSALNWLVIPAVDARQFFIFREGERPVGVAFWAFCSPEVEKKLAAGALEPANRLGAADWKSGDRLWLVDLVAPFANAQNHHAEIMLADLIAGPLQGKHLNLHRIDPTSGERRVVTLGPETIQQLKTALGAHGAHP